MGSSPGEGGRISLKDFKLQSSIFNKHLRHGHSSNTDSLIVGTPLSIFFITFTWFQSNQN